MTGRALTPAERTLTQSVFGTAINCDPVRIHNDKWWFLQPRRVAMAPRGHIHFHPQGDLYCEDFCGSDMTDQGLFIHEMTHVWQHQAGLNLILRRHPFCRYDYAIKPGWPLKRYGIEQQAEIVRHYFMLKNGWHVTGAAPLSWYESAPVYWVMLNPGAFNQRLRRRPKSGNRQGNLVEGSHETSSSRQKRSLRFRHLHGNDDVRQPSR